jgi:hypothetical protein
MGDSNCAAPSTHRYPPLRRGKRKKNRVWIPGHPGIAPVAPSRRKKAMQPIPAAGTGLSMLQVARSARRGYPGCGRGTAGQDPDGLFRTGRGTRRGERRTDGCRNGCYLNRATHDRFLPAGEERIYLTREVIRPDLNTAGPDWPPIFTRNGNSSFNCFVLSLL